jgi:methyl-accepting chemotaxis protein
MVLLLTGIIPIAISSFINLNKMKKSFEKEAFDKLVAMRDLKKDQITSFLDQTKLDIDIIVETVETIHHEAVIKLTQSRKIKKSQIERYFTERMNNIRVLAKNPFVKQAFKDLDIALDQGGGQAGGNFKGYGNKRYDAPHNYHSVHDKYFPIL